jgi:hypothetical protein
MIVPPGVPGPAGFSPPRPPRPRWGWKVVALLVAAAAGATVTYLAVRDHRPAATPASPPQTASPSPAPAAPQFSSNEVDAAKQHLCHVFDVSVRGQEGQGGLRVEGNLNVPMVLRTLNSATAVQNALVPAVPSDVASAARKIHRCNAG